MAWQAKVKAVGTLYTGDVNGITREAMQGVDTFAKDMLESLTPVDTGYMKGHWSVQTSDRLIEIRNSANYSQFINGGTRKISPHFMVEKTIEAATEQFRENLQNVISSRQRTKTIRDLAKEIAKIRPRNVKVRAAAKV